MSFLTPIEIRHMVGKHSHAGKGVLHKEKGNPTCLGSPQYLRKHARKINVKRKGGKKSCFSDNLEKWVGI